MSRIVVGLSGGVDSAAAAYLLRQEGHEVLGVTLRTWESGSSRCCEIDDARETAQMLGIPYHVINCAADFQKTVEAPFAEDRSRGVTPNPCVVCNREIKWKWMLYAAALFDADAVATGHYASLARMENGRLAIAEAADRAKDQSYMLCRLTQEQLAKSIFPLGAYTKQEVRRIAECAGLPTAQKRDSQELCFAERAGEIPSEPGVIVDEHGAVLGTHRGYRHYTVGQRRGLGVAMGEPFYVKRILPAKNTLVAAPEAALLRRECLCGELCFQSIPALPAGDSLRAVVKIRSHHAGAPAVVEARGDGTALLRFDAPVRAPAPGQSAVFYDAERCVIGAGVLLPEA